MSVAQQIRSYIVDNILFGDGEKLQVDTSFQEHGIIDSLGFVELISFVEKKFGIEIKDDELIPENFDSLQKITRFVESRIQNPESRIQNGFSQRHSQDRLQK